MEPDLIRALGISGAILIGVVVLIIVVSMIAVKRGESSMSEGSKHHH
jgi:hypothetical protein